MPNIVLHIGLHKTATTTLQQQYFTACDGLNYITAPDVGAVIHAATITDPLFYDVEAARNRILPYLCNNMPNLISRESISGAIFSGLMKPGLDHRLSILENIKGTLPEARIIIVLRRQDRLAYSLYRQYLKSGGTESVRRFYGFGLKRTPLLSHNRFRFTPYVDNLISSFPSGVLILIFEEFLYERSKFLSRIVEFLGIDAPSVELKPSNMTSIGSMGMEFSRILNHFFRSQLNPGGLIPGIPRLQHGELKWVSPALLFHDRWPIKGVISEKSQLYKASKKILESVYDDNQELESKYNLGLEKYEYFNVSAK